MAAQRELPHICRRASRQRFSAASPNRLDSLSRLCLWPDRWKKESYPPPLRESATASLQQRTACGEPQGRPSPAHPRIETRTLWSADARLLTVGASARSERRGYLLPRPNWLVLAPAQCETTPFCAAIGCKLVASRLRPRAAAARPVRIVPATRRQVPSRQAARRASSARRGRAGTLPGRMAPLRS